MYLQILPLRSFSITTMMSIWVALPAEPQPRPVFCLNRLWLCPILGQEKLDFGGKFITCSIYVNSTEEHTLTITTITTTVSTVMATMEG